MESKLQALKVADLKKLLQDANLPVSGTKAELIKRLLEHPTATTSLGGGGGEEEDLLGEYDADPPAATTDVTVATKAAPAVKVATPAPSSSKPAVPSPAKATSSTTTATKEMATATATAPTGDAPVQSAEDGKAALIEELEKRKMRALKFGMPTSDAEAKLQRAIKFGAENTDHTLKALKVGLKDGGVKKDKEALTKPDSKIKTNAAVTAPSKSAETEEEKAIRLAKQEADEVAKRKRAERFGIPIQESGQKDSTKIIDPMEEEKKRKRMEKFGGGTASAEPADKRVKA